MDEFSKYRAAGRRLQADMLFILRSGASPPAQCPICSHDLLPVPETMPYDFYKVDPSLRKFQFVKLCIQCPKVLVKPKTLGDIWAEICSQWDIRRQIEKKDALIARRQEEMKQEQEEAKAKGVQCPSLRCRRYINIEKLSKNEWTITEKGMVLQCPYCRQLILIPKERFNAL
jgi:DNA-directed RNA polymerase subunit RPC12/RpoP